MNRRRFVLTAVLLCIPTAMLVGIGVYFAVTRVPKLVKYEPTRIGLAYRAVAEDLAAHPETAEYSGERQREWGQQRGKINGRPWGRQKGDTTTLVWCQASDGRFVAKKVETMEEIDFALIFYGGGGLAASILVALAAFGVWSAARLLRERDDFLAATAHDLTTPLVGLRYAIGRDSEEARRLNERMIRLVGNIKDFLRMGGRRKPPESSAFDLAEVCREAYSLFAEDYRDLFDGRDVEIDVAGDVRAFADETMALQIVWNLFGNDLKYAAPFGRVSVRLFRRGGMVVAEFADEGQGMTRRQMRRAFDRYYRAKTALESGKGGFGIGLCTSREFARSMGGDLTVRRNEPKGCIFELTLPAPL